MFYINTFHGIRHVEMGLIEMGRAYGLSTWQLFWQIIFPGAMPSILLGLRIALGVMWLTLIVVETIAVPASKCNNWSSGSGRRMASPPCSSPTM